MYINHGPNTLPIKVDVAEEKYNAKFVCELSIMGKFGWTVSPSQIYYQPNPPEGYDKYFALTYQNGSLLISSAMSVVGIPIDAIQTKAGEIIYSRATYDFRTAETEHVSIDGGLSYTKISGNIDKVKRVVLTIMEDVLVVVEDPAEIEKLQEAKRGRHPKFPA